MSEVELGEVRKLFENHSKQNEEIKASILDLTATITEIKMAVIGSDRLKIKGALQKIQDHDDYILLDKKLKWMIAGAWALIVFIFTGVLVYFKKG
jgi:hypothetical protein